VNLHTERDCSLIEMAIRERRPSRPGEAERQRGREAERQSDRVAEWQSGREAEWQSGREAERQRLPVFMHLVAYAYIHEAVRPPFRDCLSYVGARKTCALKCVLVSLGAAYVSVALYVMHAATRARATRDATPLLLARFTSASSSKNLHLIAAPCSLPRLHPATARAHVRPWRACAVLVMTPVVSTMGAGQLLPSTSTRHCRGPRPR